MPLTNVIMPLDKKIRHFVVFLFMFCFIFTSAHFATTRKKICHLHVHAILSGFFYATCANCVTCGLKENSARWSGATCVIWDLASVTCLGIFACSS